MAPRASRIGPGSQCSRTGRKTARTITMARTDRQSQKPVRSPPAPLPPAFAAADAACHGHPSMDQPSCRPPVYRPVSQLHTILP